MDEIERLHVRVRELQKQIAELKLQNERLRDWRQRRDMQIAETIAASSGFIKSMQDIWGSV